MWPITPYWKFIRRVPGSESRPVPVICAIKTDSGMTTENQFTTCYIALSSEVLSVANVCFYVVRALTATDYVPISTTIQYVALRHAVLQLPGNFSACPNDSCSQTQLSRAAADCVIDKPSTSLSQIFMNNGLPVYTDAYWATENTDHSVTQIYPASEVKQFICQTIDYSTTTYPDTMTCNATGTDCPSSTLQSSFSSLSDSSSNLPSSSSLSASSSNLLSSSLHLSLLLIHRLRHLSSSCSSSSRPPLASSSETLPLSSSQPVSSSSLSSHQQYSSSSLSNGSSSPTVNLSSTSRSNGNYSIEARSSPWIDRFTTLQASLLVACIMILVLVAYFAVDLIVRKGKCKRKKARKDTTQKQTAKPKAKEKNDVIRKAQKYTGQSIASKLSDKLSK